VKAEGIANVSVLRGANPTAIDLSKAFADTEDGATGLTYSVLSNTNSALVTTAVAGQYLNLTYSLLGTADITVRGTDKGGLYADAKFTVTVANASPYNRPATLQVGTVNQGATTITLKIAGMTESAPLTYEIVGNGYKITYKGTVYIVTKNGTQGFSVGALTGKRDNETRDSASMLIASFDKPVLSVSASASDNGGGSTFSAYDADNNLLKTVLVTGTTLATYTISDVGEISKVIFSSTNGWIGNIAYSVNTAGSAILLTA